jgi:ssDNA-binding replication factor A large subunit
MALTAGDPAFDELLASVAAARNEGAQTVLSLVKQKQDEFSGLLTARGALQLIAQDAGLDTAARNSEEIGEIIPIADATDGSDVLVRVFNIFAPKAFEKNERKGRVCNILVFDGKTKASLVLWNRDVDLVERGKLERNDFLLVKNAQVKNVEQVELHSSMLTRIVIRKPDDLPPSWALPVAGIERNDVPVKKLADIKTADADFDCYGRVLRVDEEKEFVNKTGKKGKLAGLLVSDGTAQVRVVLWDKNADIARWAKVGDSVKVESGYARASFSGAGVEVNVGWKGHALLHPHKHGLADKETLMREMYKEKALSDVAEGEEAIAQGTLMSITNAVVVKKCRNCKATVREGGKCEKCGETRLRDLLVVGAVLSDGTKDVRAAFFDAQALELLDLHEPGADLQTSVELKREYLIGKKVRGVFAAKTNSFSGEREVTARHVISVA